MFSSQMSSCAISPKEKRTLTTLVSGISPKDYSPTPNCHLSSESETNCHLRRESHLLLEAVHRLGSGWQKGMKTQICILTMRGFVASETSVGSPAQVSFTLVSMFSALFS